MTNKNIERDPPSLEELESAELTHEFGDNFNPPGLTNFYASLQAGFGLTAIKSFTAPPLSSGESMSPSLYLNGVYFNSTGPEISFSWRPDRIVRKARHDGLKCSTETRLVDQRPSAIVKIELTNETNDNKNVELGLRLASAVTLDKTAWDEAEPPQQDDNEITELREEGYQVTGDRKTSAAALQGVTPRPDEVESNYISYNFTLGPDRERTIYFFYLLGKDDDKLKNTFQDYRNRPDRYLVTAEEDWSREISSLFDREDSTYSGFVPLIETENEKLRRLYYNSIVGTIYHKRFFDGEKTYVTLMPRYWQTTTFLWDISLSSVLFSILDPSFLRDYIEDCLRIDIHSHHSLENMTGEGAGPWYSVNDFATLKMVYNYLKYNGNYGWLDREIGGETILSHLKELATHWQELDKNNHGLADYGGVGNLLECVYSYVHEVPSLNAANVFNLNFVGDLYSLFGRNEEAAELKEQAEVLASNVKELYIEGGGYWQSRQPDGSLRPVNHCYDYLTIMETFRDHLSPRQVEEMNRTFEEELMTETWMRALSPRDKDAVTSVRPDHQWLGSYTAWPALSLLGVFNSGKVDLGSSWLEGIADTARQGPFGQAHVVKEAMKRDAGGARKSPSDFPYICDWACVSNGSYFQTILEGVFGLEVGLKGRSRSNTRLGALDDKAKLRGLRIEDEMWNLSSLGLEEID